MSPNEVFAAQMWPWPDALIKRDGEGRVLIVNAAFLSLYGGQVGDWVGNGITGWNAPSPTGQAMRFETRIPNPMGGEAIYDWIEHALADGTFLALARNVTDIVAAASTPPPGPQPGHDALPPTAQPPVHAHEQYVPAAEPVAPPPATVDPLVAEPAPVAAAVPHAETQTRPDVTGPELDLPDISVPNIEVGPIATLEIDVPDLDLPQAEPVGEAAPELPEPQPRDPEVREFERRALPIENNDAVLGNNWRDAVIAKAVGAEGPAEPAEAAAPATGTSVAPPATDGTIRILLAEDNAINALLTRTLLEAEGHTVDTVEDGALAVDAVRANTYDLIFMDMRMPNMDGLEATRKIRTLDHRSKGLPIVALTANAFDDDRNACFDSGMNDFMTKPVSAEELAEMVQTWARKPAGQDMDLAI